MDTAQIADAIERFVATRDYVTFVQLRQLSNSFPVEGTFAIEGPGNVVLWEGLSREVADAMGLLVKAGRVHYHPTIPLVYMVDGEMLKLPVVKRTPPPGGFKEPRWLPVCLRTVQVKPPNRRASTSAVPTPPLASVPETARP